MSVTITRRLLRTGLIGAFALLSSALFITPAAADTTYLRLAHLSPDTPAVDVYVASVADPGTSMIVLRGVAYGALSEYQVVPGGQYTVSMRPAGAAESTPPVIATTLDATAGSAYTVAGVGTFAELGLTVLTDDLSLPPDGQGRARVIQAAASTPTLDITVQGGMTLGRDVEFATTTPYSDVAAGPWVLQVSAGDQAIAELPITVDAGSVYSVLILDTPTGVSAVMQVDATAAGVVPAGGVETGGGGLGVGYPAASERGASSDGSQQWAIPGIFLVPGVALIGLSIFVASHGSQSRRIR